MGVEVEVWIGFTTFGLEWVDLIYVPLCDQKTRLVKAKGQDHRSSCKSTLQTLVGIPPANILGTSNMPASSESEGKSGCSHEEAMDVQFDC